MFYFSDAKINAEKTYREKKEELQLEFGNKKARQSIEARHRNRLSAVSF